MQDKNINVFFFIKETKQELCASYVNHDTGLFAKTKDSPYPCKYYVVISHNINFTKVKSLLQQVFCFFLLN